MLVVGSLVFSRGDVQMDRVVVDVENSAAISWFCLCLGARIG